MSIVAVDLAAKYSAAVQLSHSWYVLRQWDSTGYDEATFVAACCRPFDGSDPDQIVVEDLPHGVGFRGLVKRVCQIQGRFAENLDRHGDLDKLLFVAPATWRANFPALRKRGLGMDAVIPVAAEHGYTPPPMPHLAGPRGGTALQTKVHTDYCAAFLIGVWAVDTKFREGTYDVPGTNRYAKPTMRKGTRAEGEEQS